MAIFHGHAVALRAHSEGSGHHARAVERAQQLLRFLLHLLFFVLDVRNHVAEDIERRNSWISRAADRLHRDSHNRLKLKTTMKRSQRQQESNGRTIRIRDREPSRLAAPGLRLDE